MFCQLAPEWVPGPDTGRLSGQCHRRHEPPPLYLSADGSLHQYRQLQCRGQPPCEWRPDDFEGLVGSIKKFLLLRHYTRFFRDTLNGSPRWVLYFLSKQTLQKNEKNSAFLLVRRLPGHTDS